MWIFEHNFVADKAKIRRRAVARQVFFTQDAAKFAEKTRIYACEDRFLVQAVPVAPFSRGNAVDVLKGSGKMQGVLIAHGVSNVADGEGGQLEQLRRLCHAEAE